MRRPLRLGLTFAVLSVGSLAFAALSKKERAAGSEEARTLMASKRYEEAAKRWEDVLSPGASDKLLRRDLPPLGRCYEETQNYQKALTAYQRALRFDEDDVDRLLDLARVYVRVDLDREAIELYKRVLKLDKDRHDARLALARLYLKTGQWDDARREGELYAHWEPRDIGVLRLLAEVDEAHGDLPSAALRREGILARDPSPEGYFDLGRLWVRAGRWDSADAAFNRAEELGMRTGSLYLYLGVVRWQKGDGPGARVLWRKALDRYPGMGAAHFFLALAAFDSGDKKEAASQAARAPAGAQSDFLKELLTYFPTEKK